MNHKIRLAIIFIGLIVIGVLGQRFLLIRSQHERVDAAGKVTFTFNGLPPTAPVFNENDFKPGDCYIRPVTAQNDGTNIAQVNLQSLNIANPDGLDKVLYITISSGSRDVYGGSLGSKTLTQFFADSQNPQSLPLALIKAAKGKTFQFKVCMPDTVGNEYQKTRLSFDIIFGVNPYTCVPGNLVVTQSNNTTVVNNIIINSSTGNNQISGTVGGSSIAIGPSNTSVSITNTAGSNILAPDILECCTNQTSSPPAKPKIINWPKIFRR